jgi:hypothetical protein
MSNRHCKLSKQAEPERDDNRLCGYPTKSGKPCRAHAEMQIGGIIIGCHLHDPRRITHAKAKAQA